MAPMFKSRLINRGDLENISCVRTTLPCVGFLLSSAACERLTVQAGDIVNDYCQDKPLDRLTFLKPPRERVLDG